MTKLPLIALDGPSGAGKSTTARRVAEALQWSYLDTGGMYRCVALASMRAGVGLGDPRLPEVASRAAITQRGSALFLDGEDVSDAIRTPDVTRLVSPLSADAAVRDVLVAQQRRIGQSGKWVVDGRDIGTIVFPNACCKVFLTASVEARAERRYLELQAKGIPTTLAEVQHDIAQRDHQDTTRPVAPLRKADGAWELDNGSLAIDEVVERIVQHHRAHA